MSNDGKNNAAGTGRENGGIPDTVKYPRAVRIQLIGYLFSLDVDFREAGRIARRFAEILGDPAADSGDPGVDLQIRGLKRELDHLIENLGHIRNTL